MLQEQLNQTFLQEYLDRTLFVFLHGGLMALYLVLLGVACVRLRRERKALRRLEEDWDAEPAAGEQEGGDRRQLEGLRQALDEAPKTALSRQMRAIVGTTAAGEDFDTQRVLTHLGRSLAAADDIIRFCINGLVIVGLMGTLYAFYQMWGAGGAPELSADNSSVYLESLSTALIVSFVGLLLALVTNFFFSLMRWRRQALLEDVAGFLAPVAGLLPTDAKTHMLLTNLLAPLENLVAQITRQNDVVLRGLTEAVHTRTEQLNVMIGHAAGEWQKTLGAFRSETLTAVGELRQAAGRLADSSHQVAGTMSEVSRALERTKDIGRIVNRLEASSGEVIKTIGSRLDAATADWAVTYVRAAQSYEAALQRQSDAVRKASQEVTAAVVSDFKSLLAQALARVDELKEKLAGTLDAADQRLASTLDGFAGKFAASLESLSTKWMTEASALTDASSARLGGIVDGWQTAVTATAGSVRSALDGSRDLAAEMKDSVAALGEDLLKLQGLARVASETAGAPLYLGKAVEHLGQIKESLAALAAKLEYGQALQQLQQTVAAGRDEVQTLGERVARLGAATQAETRGVAEGLRGLDARFGGVGQELAALRADVQQLPERVRPPRRQSAPPKPPEPPKGFWARLRDGFGWTPERSRRAAEDHNPADGDEPDEATSDRS